MELDKEIRKLLSVYGTRSLLETLIDQYTDGVQDYEIRLTEDLQKTLHNYESRYDK
jgi:hypothetical protein